MELSICLLILSSCFWWNCSCTRPPSETRFSDLTECLTSRGVKSNALIQRSTGPNSTYPKLNHQWNKYGGLRKPFVYLLVRNAQDVQTAVVCANKLNIRIVCKGGGHSYAKYSFGGSNTLVIDLQKLDRISIDRNGKKCQIGPGVLTGQILWKLYENDSLMIPLGTCPTVGISGLALGGGHGFLSRLFGLTSDHILELEMVDAAGKLLTANDKTNSDLFWALRGAGGGSFGIVTRFKFKVVDTPQIISFGSKTFDITMFPKVFDAYQQLLKSNPEIEIDTPLVITDDQIMLNVFEAHKLSQNRGSSQVQKILNKFPTTRGHVSIESLTYPEFLVKTSNDPSFGLSRASQLQNLTRLSLSSRYFKAKSFFVKEFIGAGDIWAIYLLLREIPNKNNIVIEIRPFGGMINSRSTQDSSFVHRNSLYLVQIIYNSKSGNDVDIEMCKAWMRKFFDATKVILKHTESYQNYVDEELEDYLERYYGANLERLIKIKKLIDPDNYFHNAQSIPLNQ